uniref:Vacuolar protein sorting-associated protein 13 VPS13 adaptor binding domain-containing protein n=1 Tax=Leersia perrieri TaxID=77586 RepID=A0A0D9Y124_9ORYZ
MVLAEAARARLLALLRPWLAAEPDELRVELGLLRTRAVARGVELDAAVLGGDDDAVPGSFPVRVDRVAVAEVELVASPWSAPGLEAVVRGVDVVLTLREPAPRKQRPDIKDWAAKERKRVIASIDPLNKSIFPLQFTVMEGEMLHEKIEDLVSSLEDKFTSVFSSALLNCSQVRFDDVTIQVRYLDDSHLVILRAGGLQFGPEHAFRCSLFRGLVGTKMPSRKRNHLFVKFAYFELLLKDNDHIECTASFTGTTASIRLDNFQLTAFGIHVASVYWEIAPKAIPSLMVILAITSQKEDYKSRSGRELWKLAAQKLEIAIASHRFSLSKAISCASFWQRYVHAYVLLLSLVGYPSDKVIRRSCSRAQSTRKVRETIRDHLKTVIELEEKIPTEAIARGRNVARSKLIVSQQQSEQQLSKSLLVSYIFSGNRGCTSCAQAFPRASEDSEIEVQLSIHLGELSVTFLPLGDHFTSTPKLDNGNKAYHIDVPAMHLVTKSSYILYTAGCTTWSFFFVIGELKARLSGNPKLLQVANGSITRRNSSFGTDGFAEDTDSKTILWSDSAGMHPYSGKKPDESVSYNSDSSIALLQSDMEELWSLWTVVSTFYNDSGVMHHEKPSVIFELKSSLIDPYKSTSGFQQCRLTVGRVNLDLDYLCASSTCLLYRQFVHYKELKELTEKPAEFWNISDCSTKCTSGVLDNLRSFNQRMKLVISDAIPENTLQISALIAGPIIRLQFDKRNMLQNSKDKQVPLFPRMNNKSCITLSLAYVECVIWPASLSSLTPLKADSHVKKSHNTFAGVKEQPEHHLLALESAGHAYSGTAVHACLRFSDLTLMVDHIEENQQSHIFGPMSTNFQLSTSRKTVNSFFVAGSILSINIEGRVVGCMAFLFMDELFAICQLIESMQRLAFDSDLVDIKYSQCFIGRLASHFKGSTMGSGVDYIIQEEAVGSRHTELMVEMELDLEPMHIILNGSRDELILNSAVFSNVDINYISSSPVLEGIEALGVWFCSRSSSLKFLLDGQCIDILVSFSGFQSIVFENQPQMSICNDILQSRTMLCSSPYDKNQLTIPDCVIHLYAGPNKDILINEKLQDESISGCNTDSLAVYYFIQLEFTEVYVGDYSMHNYLTEVNKPSKQKITLLIHDDLQIVKCKTKGGLIFLETLSLAKFVFCCKIYFRLLIDLSSRAASNSIKVSVASVSAGNDSTVTNRSSVSIGVHPQCEESQLSAFKCLDVDFSQLSLTLAIADESGRYQGLTLDVDAILQLLNLGMKIVFEVKNISVSSISIMHSTSHVQFREPAPRFRSSKSVVYPSQSEIQEHLPFIEADNVLTYDNDAPSSSNSTMESSTSNPSQEFSSQKSYILRHFSTYLKLEKKEHGDSSMMRSSGDWFGHGSVSGLEVTMSLSSIEMISSLIAPFHGILSSGSTQKEIQTGGTSHQELLDNMDYTIPDGAIVAIRDLDQQMYVSVKNTGSKSQVVGTYHYSLSGEHALFKVKHHKGWRSDASCISLISLYAKTNEGKELALGFSHGSDLVEVSSSVDKPSSLWTTIPLRFDSFEDESDDGKSCKIISRMSYHLINKKNNYGIAFIDGLLEFVKKPGNPFKVKVLDQSLFSDVARTFVPNVNLDNNTYLNVENELPFAVRDSFETGVNSEHVIINVDKIIFTITHEVLDTGNVFPLVQNCINDTRIVTQIFPSKIRILSALKVTMQYFNAQKYMWFTNLVPVTIYRRMPLRFFFHLKQADIFINELSVDILLYVVGKLNVMGPYAVKSSAIFPNCCKIENNSRLTLVCHFHNNEDAIVSGQQSTSVFLRNLAFEDNHPHDQSVVSISLFKEGVFSTAPINVSLLDSGIFAWRTRVLSLKDSRSFSGPFVVAKVSQNSEEGLSLSIQPLLRIYNKSDFPLELRFQRPHKSIEEAAFVTLRSGDMIDESTGVFDLMDLSGGSKRALMSLALGKPEISKHSENFGQTTLVKWSEDITGEKAVRISGVMEKLNYNIRRAFSINSMKSSFSSLSCHVSSNGQHVTDLHFLVHTLSREVPLRSTNGSPVFDRNASVALQLQREIFIYPTVLVYNFLQTDIHVILTDCEPENTREDDFDTIGKQATITSGSSAYLYVNPAKFTFSVTLISYSSKSKAVNSTDWVKRMQKQTSRAQFLDVELEFVIGTGRFHSSLRLLRQEKGFLEVVLFTRYTLHNTSDYPLLCTDPHKKSLPMSGTEKETINLPPQDGCILASMSMSSWFTRSSKLRIGLHNEKGSEAFIDLEALSGFTEFSLEIHDNILPRRMATFGMYLQPVLYDLPVPSQVVLIVPRYVFSNESASAVAVRQCFVEDDIDGVTIEAKQKATLHTWKPEKRREVNYFDLFVKKHRNVSEDSHIFIQFCPKETGYCWSGPICVSSIGRFFVKFRRSQGMVTDDMKRGTLQDGKLKQFASVDVIQETASFVLHFTKPPKAALPYRIENCLNEASIMYLQKDSVESDVLHPQESEQYIWDDLRLPRKLVVHTPALREIKIDKISPWKPFLKMSQTSRLNIDSSFNNGLSSGKQRFGESFGLRVFKIGYEVYADGLTRVLRICEHADIPKVDNIQHPIANVQFRITCMCIHLLEKDQQGEEKAQSPSTILAGRFQHVSADSVITDRYRHISLAIHSFNVDEKWEGASFGSILRRSKLQDTLSENILRMIITLNSTNSSVKQVQYCSIILQPIDLKVDEETLMKIVPFWRTSLAPPGTPSTQYYFRHFEVHPIKIIASFRPGSPHATYSSAQEALRALLHSVIKVPEISSSAVELNGVLLNHALVTFRELFLKCAQHYSWYVLRAIYVTKGSSLLPPSFASIFDDSASSVIDVFFDPSDGSLNLPGLTIGMFKFISKNMKSGGFSGTKRYLGDLGKTVKTASSNALFAAVTEISDSIVRGAEANGFNGMVTGFHQGILRLAMEPSVLGQAILEGGPDRKIKLDHSPGLDELYIEGYLQAMLDVMYKQEYLRIRVVDDQVILKNLPPNSALINEIVENVKGFLVSKGLLKGDSSTIRPLRRLRNEPEWRIAPTVLTLAEHLFVSFAVRMLHREASKAIAGVVSKAKKPTGDEGDGESSSSSSIGALARRSRVWTVGRFAISGVVAYIDGRLCRHIPNPIARRIVSGFLLSFIDNRNE